MPPTPQASRAPRGRRPGEDSTREAILDAALHLFAAHGYDRTTMRAVAQEAGTDPGMIRHWFGDKEGLFVATVIDRTVTVATLREALLDDRPGRGRRIAHAYLSLWEDPATRPILLALVRTALASGQGQATLMRLISALLMGRPASEPPGAGAHAAPDTLASAEVPGPGLVLVGSHLIGVAFTRFVLELPPAVAIGRDDLLDRIGPVIDGYLDVG